MNGERRRVFEPSDELRETAEHEGLPAAERDLERSRRGQPGEDRMRRLDGPLAFSADVTRTELAREVAAIRDAEHDDARRTTAKAPRPLALDANVRSGRWLEEQRRPVQRMLAKAMEVHAASV